MKNSVIAIQFFVITTIVYAFLVPIFFEIDNAFGEREYIVDEDANNKVMYSQQVVDTKCKSPCPSSAEMCIAMCA
jgi:archaellum component FlaF (FlaF/FlaG flagellin family)